MNTAKEFLKDAIAKQPRSPVSLSKLPCVLYEAVENIMEEYRSQSDSSKIDLIKLQARVDVLLDAPDAVEQFEKWVQERRGKEDMPQASTPEIEAASDKADQEGLWYLIRGIMFAAEAKDIPFKECIDLIIHLGYKISKTNQ